MGVILTHPVAMRRAEFWTTCSRSIECLLVFGNQIGAAYVNREPTRDLKVATRVCFCCPQLVPVRSFKMFSLGVAL